MRIFFKFGLAILSISYCIIVQAQTGQDSLSQNNDSIINDESDLLSGFSLRPGMGTAFVDVFITRRGDQYEAKLTDARDSFGSPFLSFSVLSPKYYFYEKSIATAAGRNVPTRWGVGVRSETHTFSLDHQTLAQNENFEPENIGTSVSGIMTYVAFMMYVELINTDRSNKIPNLVMGLGYTKGIAELGGSAIFGPERNTTGITESDDVSIDTSDTSGFTFLVEMESEKYVVGFEVATVSYQNESYKYLISGAKFYLSIPFSF